jgi:NitT/TauT family transport system substrate-binding protein
MIKKELHNDKYPLENTNPIRKLLRLLLLIALIPAYLLLTACGEKTEDVLRVGSNNWVGYSPLFLGREIGAYDDSTVRLIELPSASEVIHAFRYGNLEVAALTLDEVLTLIEEGMELQVILVLDISRGADVLLAKPEISSVQQLVGKTVAVEHTAVGALLLDKALVAAGLAVKDINIVGCTFDKHLDCYQRSDAIVTFEPVKSRILKLGANTLFDSSQIDGEIMDVLVVNKSTSVTHPKGIKRLIEGYFDARAHMRKNTRAANVTIGKLIGLNEREVSLAYQGLHLPGRNEIVSILEGSPSKLEKLATKLNSVMLQRKLMSKTVEVSKLSNSEFLDKR